jgi:hypothetical protein
LKVNLSLEVYIDKEEQPKPLHFDYPSVEGKPEIIIVGAGPAGLYCALRLIELGYKPILFERGKEVVERGKDIAKIQRNQGVNPDSNYAFGEGGAGTFSDGKLFTRSKKRGDYNRALQRLVFHGASPEILFEAHPHIGSDRLPRIIANMREAIRSAGGDVHFEKRVEELIVRNGKVEGVVVGGGSALLALVPGLEKLAVTLDGDERTGVMLAVAACKAPVIRIAENAGVNGLMVVERLREQPAGMGYDAAHGTYVDLFEAGIIDPVRVTRSAVEAAFSVAETLLLTEAGVTPVKGEAPTLAEAFHVGGAR